MFVEFVDGQRDANARVVENVALGCVDCESILVSNASQHDMCVVSVDEAGVERKRGETAGSSFVAPFQAIDLEDGRLVG